jgi:predicted transposase YbfD/YdcC
LPGTPKAKWWPLTASRLCIWSRLGQHNTGAKSNEIKAIPELLRVLELTGTTVTINAMGCQKSIASQIVEQRGDYVLAVKENQPSLMADIKDSFQMLAADAQRINRAIRQHWGIENKLYWVLDVAFREDLSRKRSGYAAENFSVLNRIALNLIRKDKSTKGSYFLGCASGWVAGGVTSWPS